MGNHSLFPCAPLIAGLRQAPERRRSQHFGNSWRASKESERHSSSPSTNRDRGRPRGLPLPHHRTYGSVSGGSAD